MFPLIPLIAAGGNIATKLMDTSAEDAAKRYQQQYNDLQNINDQYEWQAYKPEEYGAGQQVSEDPALRQGQMEYLKKLAGLSETGLSPQDEAVFARSRQEAAMQARQGREAAYQNAKARGMGGGGMEFAMGEIARQGAANRQNQGNYDQAATAAKQRALYNQAYGDAMSGVRNQDLNVNKTNADIINEFNRLNVGTRNQAKQYNQQGLQNTFNQNVQNKINKFQAGSGLQNKAGDAQAAKKRAELEAAGAGFNMFGKMFGG